MVEVEKRKSGQFAIIPARSLDDIRFDDKDKHLRCLLVLGTFADKNGRCYPALATIGEQIGAARSTVSAIVHDLEEWGYVKITAQVWSDAGQTSNLYRIIHDAELPVQFDRTSPECPLHKASVKRERGVRKALKKSDTNVPSNDPIECPSDGAENAPTLPTDEQSIDSHSPNATTCDSLDEQGIVIIPTRNVSVENYCGFDHMIAPLPVVAPDGSIVHQAAPDVAPIVIDEMDLRHTCGDCGEALTLVRPGKYQCDNEKCPSVARFEEAMRLNDLHMPAVVAPAPDAEQGDAPVVVAAKKRIAAILASKECGQNAEVSDPKQAERKFIKTYAPIFAQIIGRAEPITEDKSAAKRAYEKHFDCARMVERLQAYTNGEGAEFRKKEATAFWIVNRLERDLAKRTVEAAVYPSAPGPNLNGAFNFEG